MKNSVNPQLSLSLFRNKTKYLMPRGSFFIKNDPQKYKKKIRGTLFGTYTFRNRSFAIEIKNTLSWQTLLQRLRKLSLTN